MKNKTLIYIGIVLLIVAGAAFFFFKKKNSGTSTASDAGSADSNSSKFLDLNDTDSIVSNLSVSDKTALKKWIKNIKSWVKNNDKWKSSTIQQSAESREWTYSQALVLSALWQMYATDKVITRAQYDQYESELNSLKN
ncbi:MAG: LPXTG cell wall anchor domain-containing protein [Bacteroidales bacterium]|nr:LPXTG cell wall anchor domain-containing protein [Bacteroidales bacterium]